ncbi:uncharacterized protein [Elaeis guineensis]|uniref:uncharacterized protein isoform X2 n=1 Tax=Elaeis guineensis var. tenera TaxID=51953 RepID=UPI003C6D7769
MNLCPLHVDISLLQNIRMKGIQILSGICPLFSTLLYGEGHDIFEMCKAGEDVISMHTELMWFARFVHCSPWNQNPGHLSYATRLMEKIILYKQVLLGQACRIDLAVCQVWVAYRESKLIHTVLWIVLLVCFGSIATCAYIVKKLFVISPADVKDPVSRVLLRNDDECKLKFSSVMFGRILFSVLGVLVLATVVSTIIIDGFPFQKELLTPWMAATLIDFYINVIAISVWVAHKESTWISALFWICLLICFGSIATCTYIVLQLFQLSYQDSMYHILLDSHSKHGSTSSK